MSLGSGEIWPNRHLVVTQRLRQRRDELGLTQKQVVARLARLGVRTTNRALSNLEHGAGVNVARLPELAVALDCTVTFLLGLTDKPDQWGPDYVPPSIQQHPAAPTTAHTVPEQEDLTATDSDCHCWILGTDIPDRELPVLPVTRRGVNPLSAR